MGESRSWRVVHYLDLPFELGVATLGGLLLVALVVGVVNGAHGGTRVVVEGALRRTPARTTNTAASSASKTPNRSRR